MKRTSLSLLTMIFTAFSFFAVAQNPSGCRLNAKFDLKSTRCAVTFTDATMATIGTTIKSWRWSFGDGDTSNVQNPTHTYKYSGRYTATVTIVGVNAAGVECKDRASRTISVRGCAGDSTRCRLSAKINYVKDSNSCNISFHDSSNVAPSTKVISRTWTFGDGSPSSNVQNPTHLYKYSGRYTASLVIVGVNAEGDTCRDRTSREISLRGCAGDSTRCRLSARIHYVKDSNSCNISFHDSSKVASSTKVISRTWTFGDGSPSSTIQNPTHLYKYSGRYTASLVIVGVNAEGDTCRDRTSREISLRGCAGDSTRCRLSARIHYVKDSNSCNISFHDSSKVASSTKVISRTWTFGDGSPSSNVQNPTHAYKYSGRYTATLIIVGVNAEGDTCRDRSSRVISLRGCAGDTTRCRLSAKIKYVKDSSSCNVTFLDSSKVASSTTVKSWHWSFGDGDTSNLQNPTHAYKYSGRYTACLTIIGVNAAGETCRDKDCREVTLRGCAADSTRCRVSSKFTYVADSTNVKFNDSSKVASTTTITKWHWSFGDGTTDSVQNPTHVYNRPGRYNVCLTIEGVNAAGETCRDKECRSIGVKKRGVDEGVNNVSLAIYPNPAKDLINISFEMAKEGQADVTVSDMQGRTLFVVKEGYFNKGTQNLNWTVGLPSGWYLVTVKTDAAIEHKQLFIQE